MLVTLLILAFLEQPLPEKIEAIDVFKDMLISKEGPNLLLVSSVDRRIALADAKGKIVAAYDKKGDGPTEINTPIYLGKYRGKFLILSHWNRLLLFDDHLAPTFLSKLELPGDTTFYLGVNRTDGWYWIYRGFSRSPDLVVSVQAKKPGNGFEVVKRLHPQPKTQIPGLAMATNNFIWVHNNQIFKTVNAVLDNEYEVMLLSNLTDELPTLVLTSDLTGFVPIFKDRPAIAGVNAAFSFPDGYLVRFGAKERETQKLPDSYVDVFDKKGGFRKRVKGGDDLMPCINSPNAYVYLDVDDHYHRIDRVEDWLKLQTEH